MKRRLRIFFIRSCVVVLLLVGNHVVNGQITVINSYQAARTFVNISKPNGGVFDPGDTIEIRYTILVPQSPQPSGGSGAAQTRYLLKSAQVIDTLPANVSYIPNSMCVRTNEGILYKGFFSAAVDADQGAYITMGGNNIISIGSRPSTGIGTDTLSGGTWRWNGSSWQFNNNATPPRFSNNSFGMITYRVRINAAYGQYLSFNRTSLWFRGVSDLVPLPKYRFPRNVIAIFQSPGLCTSGLALSNVFETNGTFGRAKPRNRGTTSPIVPTGAAGYTFVTANNNSPNDGSYAIVNNTSDAGSNNASFNGRFFAPKIFDIFDIIGDHTGASNPVLGNPPTDTAVAAPPGGYMLLVNASYFTNAAVTQTIRDVCKNTYYEFSAWFRNVCARCGSDSLGNGNTTWGPGWPPNPAYLSWPGNDSAGVRPNLAFEINDTTYYTSGDMRYDKTQTAPWRKRGFLFLNSMDSFRITIRNNSPGGGGNDWVMDDVGVSACIPSLSMNYTPFVLGCRDQPRVDVNLICTVRYAYNGSYVYYKWQRSTNGGTIWTDIFSGGPATASFVAGAWQYTTNYAFSAVGADSGHRFRVVVATSPANLSSPTCSFTDGNSTYLRFITCGNFLISDLLAFKGELVASKAQLLWRVGNENNFSHYEIEKSANGTEFVKAGEQPGMWQSGEYTYQFTDPELLNGSAYYRLKMVNKDGVYKYSKTVLLSTSHYPFALKTIANPFSGRLPVEYIVPKDGTVTLHLYDAQGKQVFSQQQLSNRGFNSALLEMPPGLGSGLYTFRIQFEGASISRKMMKRS